MECSYNLSHIQFVLTKQQKVSYEKKKKSVEDF